MATSIAIVGGLGLFLLGIAVMTDGLKALAGSALRVVLMRAAATPVRGAIWGGAVTLLVQSSSATTMTTIGLVSAGLLNFPQGLSLVFGANIGTTGTGWLVALLGVKVSLTAMAMPLIFTGALLKLLGRGRWAATGSAIAGLALLLAGLTILQEGMGGLAERLNPADLPAVTGAAGVGVWTGIFGVLQLVMIGILMTAVMQSSSAAVAATLSALHAGAVGPDQAVALVIGQNIGTAISSAMAAIGATTPAQRTALAYVLFKVITAVVALALFPLVVPLIRRASTRVDATLLLAAYHTAYNVMGVAMLLPVIGPFSRFVERLIPQRGPIFTRHLDRSVLSVPTVAVEAVRRTAASVLHVVCAAVAARLRIATAARAWSVADDALTREAADALEQARLFLAQVSDPPASKQEQQRLADTLHALDHTVRFVEALREMGIAGSSDGDKDSDHAADTCARAMRVATNIAAAVTAQAVPRESLAQQSSAMDQSIAELTRLSVELANLRRVYRRTTLASAAASAGGAVQAMARVDLVRRLDRLAYHAWRAATHLLGTQDASVTEQSSPAA